MLFDEPLTVLFGRHSDENERRLNVKLYYNFQNLDLACTEAVIKFQLWKTKFTHKLREIDQLKIPEELNAVVLT